MAFRFLFALGLAYVLSQFLRASMAVLAPELAFGMGLTADQLGFLTGAFFLAFAAVQLPVGYALDHIGPRRTVTILLLCSATGVFLFAKSESYSTLLATRILMGVGSAGTLMGAYVVFARWFPPEKFSTLAGMQLSIGNTGILLAAAPFAMAISLVGWRETYVWVAAGAVLLSLLVFSLIQDHPPNDKVFRDQGLPGPATLKSLFLNKNLLMLWPMNLVGYGAVASISTLWAGPYLGDVFGLGNIARGNLLLMLGLGSILGPLLAGPAERMAGSSRYIVLGGGGLSVLVFLGLAFLGDIHPYLAVFLMSLLTLLSGYMTVLVSHARIFYPDSLMGRGMTIANMLNMAGVAILQAVTGLVVAWGNVNGFSPEQSYQIIFLLLAGVLVVPLLLYSRVPESR